PKSLGPSPNRGHSPVMKRSLSGKAEPRLTSGGEAGNDQPIGTEAAMPPHPRRSRQRSANRHRSRNASPSAAKPPLSLPASPPDVRQGSALPSKPFRNWG